MSLEKKIIKLLLQKKYTITTVESCTGGLLMGTLLNASGASACVNEGYITYSNEAKSRLVNVSAQTLIEYGAVSVETAREMVIGGAQVAKADVAVSVTGVAGPDGGTKEKPVGLVYIGCYVSGVVNVIQCNFSGTREENRRQSVVEAMKLVITMLESQG